MSNTEQASTVVRVRGLRKSYAGRPVVDDVDLDVQAGEVAGLIGANGAGKTTTVECLQGLRCPDAGMIEVLGLDPRRDADRLRPLVGSQLQCSGLPDRLRVKEAVRLFAGPNSANGERLLERFDLARCREFAFGTMSGGEQQRLFLVLALLNRPRLVILDELTQGLDPSARREVWKAVNELRREGVTVLLVTHELVEAQALCDRVMVMRSGRVLDHGTPAELVARHADVATVCFSLSPTSADDLSCLRTLPGVTEVVRTGDAVVVTGRLPIIAHTGAWLVHRGAIPADLTVHQPDLEAALLHLLEAPDLGVTNFEREMAR